MKVRDLLVGLMLLAASLPAAATTPLVSPFAGLVIEAKGGKAKECKKAPTPYTGDMEFASKYAGSGKARDRLNPLAKFLYKRATADIEDFEKGLAAASDRHVRGQAGAAACALAWMHAWAAADALAGKANGQGKAVRKWALAAVAFNYLKIADAKALDAGQQRVVREWVSRRADQVVADYAGGDPARMNNHHYWAAAAVAASAVVSNRPDLLAWAQDIYGRAMNAIAADGGLATEMARGSRALEYHNFALSPLVMVATILQANGQQPLALQECALCRLVTRVDAGLRDPQGFAQQAGERQEFDADVTGRIVPWVAPMAALCPRDSRLAALARQYAPASARRLGGNLTELYAAIGSSQVQGADDACRQLWK